MECQVSTVLLLLLASVWATTHGILYLKDQDPSLEQLIFESFVTNHSKSYKTDPENLQARFEIFQQSLVRQKALNEYEAKYGGTALYGVNKFSDLTPEEFKGMYLSPERTSVRSREGIPSDSTDIRELEDLKFDWRDASVIGPIRDQHRCGSCWAFAVVETIESAYAIEKKQKIQHTLSSQQLLSCDYHPSDGLNGCQGGILQTAFQTVKDSMVLVEEKNYPFQSSDGKNRPCKTNLPNQGMVLTNYTYFNNIDLDSMVKLIRVSPLTTSVNAVAWQDYVGGIIQHHCDNTKVDHAIQIVGYDRTGEVPYWIIRNTWGTGWGESGYIRVLYGENMCGIRDEVAIVSGVKGVAL